jgi:hypothetical protein
LTFSLKEEIISLIMARRLETVPTALVVADQRSAAAVGGSYEILRGRLQAGGWNVVTIVPERKNTYGQKVEITRQIGLIAPTSDRVSIIATGSSARPAIDAAVQSAVVNSAVLLSGELFSGGNPKEDDNTWIEQVRASGLRIMTWTSVQEAARRAGYLEHGTHYNYPFRAEDRLDEIRTALKNGNVAGTIVNFLNRAEGK